MATCMHSATGEKGEERRVKTRLLVLLLLAGGSLFAETRFSIGVGIGVPGYYAPPPPPVVVVRPPCPGPDYAWVDGYWYPNGPRYEWRAGYWAVPSYSGAYWAAPRYYDHPYYGGYERRGCDRHRDRDEDWDDDWHHGHGRGHGHGHGHHH